jgi:general secretion pathway protein J
MRAQAGFSLIEMLVSLAILGLLSVMLLGGMQTGRRVWEGTVQKRDVAAPIAAGQLILSEVIEKSVPTTRYDASAPYAFFEGSRAAMRFHAPALTLAQPPDIRDYRLSLSRTGKLQLVASNQYALIGAGPIRTAQRSASTRETMTIAENIRSIEIDYFGAAPPDNQRRWRNSWVSRPILPELIRIQVAYTDDSKKYWPELVIRPAAQVDIDCQFNAQTLKCVGRR